ncbi:tetratricopeptide repeat protein [Roseomonas sp. USHLN139]|uniref:tetratricopeptide repeat protein n=1 Tax=Roseomonas sp. USHLN139 TaxID=3081298 RepID=UPI003B01CA9A
MLDFFPGGPSLVVVFEDARGPVLKPDPLRDVPGARFLRKEGHSVLAVKTLRRDWFRAAALWAAMRALVAAGFFAGFGRVVFHGSSMGGYGALVFSALVPGSLVLAYAPQTTLDLRRVPWDRRYPVGSAEDWSDPLSDAAVAAAAAARVVVVYDPFEPSDARHVARLGTGNLLALRLPFCGHLPAAMLQGCGQLRPVWRAFLAGTLDAAGFARLARGRRGLASYWLHFGQAARWPAVKAACLARFEAIEPATAEALLLRAEVALAAGDAAAAEAAARQGLALQPGLRPLAERLLAALEHQGRLDEALAVALAALARAPGQGSLVLAAARLHLALGEPAAAQALARAALAAQPGQERLRQLVRQLDAADHGREPPLVARLVIPR